MAAFLLRFIWPEFYSKSRAQDGLGMDELHRPVTDWLGDGIIGAGFLESVRIHWTFTRVLGLFDGLPADCKSG